MLRERNQPNGQDPFGLAILDWLLPGMNGIEAAAQIRDSELTRDLPIIIISAYAGKEEEARCDEIGVNVFLPKPLTASSLFDAIVESQGARVHSARRALGAPLERQFAGVRALLAEDNEANQMVAVELLTRLGMEIDIAVNGRVAVEMAKSNPDRYAAIFMDMQMPEMDGLEATRILRADTAFQGLPIIAMTANAMRQELDACLDAGMNDHITKPIDRAVMLKTLQRWLPRGTAVGAIADASTQAGRNDREFPVLAGIDVAETLGIEFASLRKILLRFADGQQSSFDELRAAVADGEPTVVARHAHAIAGAAGNLGAESLRAAAKALEQAARAGRSDLSVLLTDVDRQASQVLASIESLREASGDRPDTSIVPQDPALLGQVLDRLVVALTDFDPAASATALAELAGAADAGDLGPEFARMQKMVDAYDFEGAAAIVAHLRKRLEVGS